MFKIEDDIVYLTRGDDAIIDISVYVQNEDTEEEYEMQEGDRYIFTVRKLPSRKSPVVFSVESANGRIVISHNDTVNAEIGKYSADIQLNTSDGKRLTIWPKLFGSGMSSETNYKNFYIMPEVTDV